VMTWTTSCMVLVFVIALWAGIRKGTEK